MNTEHEEEKSATGAPAPTGGELSAGAAAAPRVNLPARDRPRHNRARRYHAG